MVNVNDEKQFVFECKGICPCCDSEVTFRSTSTWFRDFLICPNCSCIPRERAIMKVIEDFYPNWKELKIHESSPANRGTSVKLSSQCKNYIATHYDNRIPLGDIGTYGYRNEDLENQTFDDESFDIVVTQDVFEHIFDIDSAFKEIARTLRPGGAHIFTTPLVNFTKPTEVMAKRTQDGEIIHLHEPEFHGNPIDPKGSLVTYHFGYDICNRIFNTTGLNTIIVRIDDLQYGIRAKYIEVLVTQKTS